MFSTCSSDKRHLNFEHQWRLRELHQLEQTQEEEEERGSSPKTFLLPGRIVEEVPLDFQRNGRRLKKRYSWSCRDEAVPPPPPKKQSLLTWAQKKDASLSLSWEDLTPHQRRWDVSELCLVEMDMFYPSENMASASRGAASSPVCWCCSAACAGCGAPGRTAAGPAAPAPPTAAARRQARSTTAWSTAPAAGCRGPQQPGTSRRPPASCEYTHICNTLYSRKARTESEVWLILLRRGMRTLTDLQRLHRVGIKGPMVFRGLQKVMVWCCLLCCERMRTVTALYHAVSLHGERLHGVETKRGPMAFGQFWKVVGDFCLLVLCYVVWVFVHIVWALISNCCIVFIAALQQMIIWWLFFPSID